MSTNYIYDKLVLEYYFNKLKHLRDKWDYSTEEPFPVFNSLIDIGGKDHRQYEYIMSCCNKLAIEMLAHVATKLIEEYSIPVQYYDLRTVKSNAYYVGKNISWKSYIDDHDEKNIIAFSRTDKDQDVLFILKEFGINNRISKETLANLMNKSGLKRVCYISYVEDKAYTEVINHNNDETDPTRGTGIISYKQFIESFFGTGEYTKLKDCLDQFSKKVKDYYGFALVKKLKPKELHSFKESLQEDLQHINADKIGASLGIEKTQRDIIETHFISDKNYEVLIGGSSFAQCFITAEWLFSSLPNADKIDLTAIALGYFKAVEQLLFAYINNLSKKQNDKIRKLYIGNNKPGADESGCVILTKELMEDEKMTKDMTLGSLTGFFGYFDKKKNQYRYRNSDLLVDEIDDNTYNFVIATFGRITGLRNGYFHKDNLTEWEDVIEARNQALLVFYLLLGCYKLTDMDKVNLGAIKRDTHDDYYKLCEYINRRSYESFPFRIPIVYVNDISDPYAFLGYPHQDDFIEYDNNGEPIYSGIYLKEFGKDGRIIKMDHNHLPNEIWEGELVITESIPIKIEPSGAKKQIFCNGKFISE